MPTLFIRGRVRVNCMQKVRKKTLDLNAILASKMGRNARFVPSFLVRWLEKFIHADELNDFLDEAEGETGSVWLRHAVDFLKVTVEVSGIDNLPDRNSAKCYTIVSNHPLGGIDGVALGAVVGERTGDNFKYLVNDLLMNLPGLAPLCIPINKTGKQSRDFPEMVRRGFSSDKHMLMFPAGLCSRLIDGKIQDLPWTKTFIQKSIETQRDVIPVHFEGHNSARFYRIANICKALHLKVNLAMLFLPDEMFRNAGNTFRITIGKPIPWQTFDKSKSPKEWAQHVRAAVYGLKE